MKTSLAFAVILAVSLWSLTSAIAQTAAIDISSPQDGVQLLPGNTIFWTITAGISTGDNAGLALISMDLMQVPTNPDRFDIPPADSVPPGMDNFSRPQGISNNRTG